MNLSLALEGAERHSGAAVPILEDLIQALTPFDQFAAGRRIQDGVSLRPLLCDQGPVRGLVTRIAGATFVPVRAILFDKNAQANWSLGWHQDRTICVKRKSDCSGFGPWSVKQGMVHVEPPFAVIERMLTLRIHLDPVDEANAPLLIAPGSHLLGRIATSQIADAVDRCGTVACLAKAGDVWVYSTPIIHASERRRSGKRRRVLQVDFSSDSLPGNLEWSGI